MSINAIRQLTQCRLEMQKYMDDKSNKNTSMPRISYPYPRLAFGAAAFAVALHSNPPGAWLEPRPSLTPVSYTHLRAHET